MCTVGSVKLKDRAASDLIVELWAIAPVMLWADPPDTGANSSKQGAGPEEKGLPKRESSPLCVSITQEEVKGT